MVYCANIVSLVGVADPGSVALLIPGSGIWGEHTGSYFRVHFGLKIVEFFDADRIRVPEFLDSGSGMA
jgi:hypothetical protein